MRDRMERFIVLPFGVGCVSTSSVAVLEQQQQPSKKPNPDSPGTKEEEESLSSSENMKSSFRFLSFPKPIISSGFQRLSKSFKSFSQLFVFKEAMQEVEMEMEIGCPTDVKHVTHIGLDGSTTTNHLKGCDDLIPPELLSLSPISLTQFEFAMAAQADQTTTHHHVHNGSYYIG